MNQPNSDKLFLALPAGINPAAVLERKRQILAANPTLPHLNAEQLALDAERQQYWHDHPEMRVPAEHKGETDAELIAHEMLTLDRSDPQTEPAPTA